MTATIDEHGMLLIQANTSLESYALSRWCDKNFSGANKPGIDTNNITINVGIVKT